MKLKCPIVLLFAVVSASALAQTPKAPPAEDSARSFLISRIDGGQSARLSLATFEKIDGRTTTGADGVTRYTMFVNAEVAVQESVSVSTGIAPLGNSYPVGELRVAGATRGDVFSQLDAGANMVSSVCPGQALELEGKLIWELFESGWRRSDMEVKVAVDRKGIDCQSAAATASGSSDQPSESSAPETALARDLKSAVRARTECENLGEIRNLKRVEAGRYGANARPYYTYAFDVQMKCHPGEPYYGFRGRVDETGRVRFVVQVNPEP